VFRTYIFFITLISLYFSYKVIKPLFAKYALPYVDLILLGLAFFFFFMTGRSFGQREYICLALTFPYFFLVGAYFEGINYSKKLRVIVAILAAIGFAIKPYFLFALIFTEAYLFLKKRTWKTVLRIETITIFVFMWLYLASIFILTPNYIFKVLPIVSIVYLPHGHFTLDQFILHNKLWAWLVVFLLALWQGKRFPYPKIIGVLQAALLGFILAYLMQGKVWFYHLLPLLGIAFVLTILLFTQSLGEILIKLKSIGKNLVCTFQMIVAGLLLIGCFGSMLYSTNAWALIYRYSSRSYPLSVTKISKHFHYKGPALFLVKSVLVTENAYQYSSLTPATQQSSLSLYKILAEMSPEKFNTPRVQWASKKLIHILMEDLIRTKPGMIVSIERDPTILIFLLKHSPQFKAFFKRYYLVGQWRGFDVYARKSLAFSDAPDAGIVALQRARPT